MAKHKIAKLSPEFKEALALLTGRPEFKTFVKFLKVQQNNIAVIEWFRLKSTEPEIELRRRKAYFEGQFDFINSLQQTFEEARKGKE